MLGFGNKKTPAGRPCLSHRGYGVLNAPNHWPCATCETSLGTLDELQAVVTFLRTLATHRYQTTAATTLHPMGVHNCAIITGRLDRCQVEFDVCPFPQQPPRETVRGQCTESVAEWLARDISLDGVCGRSPLPCHGKGDSGGRADQRICASDFQYVHAVPHFACLRECNQYAPQQSPTSRSAVVPPISPPYPSRCSSIGFGSRRMAKRVSRVVTQLIQTMPGNVTCCT